MVVPSTNQRPRTACGSSTRTLAARRSTTIHSAGSSPGSRPISESGRSSRTPCRPPKRRTYPPSSAGNSSSKRPSASVRVRTPNGCSTPNALTATASTGSAASSKPPAARTTPRTNPPGCAPLATRPPPLPRSSTAVAMAGTSTSNRTRGRILRTAGPWLTPERWRPWQRWPAWQPRCVGRPSASPHHAS